MLTFSRTTIEALAQALNPEFIKQVIRFGSHLLNWRQSPVLYEALEFENCLEILDPKGLHAVNNKRKKVRFLQNNVFAIQDHVWGDGELFEDYKCSPGVKADCYREGQGYSVLMSLRESKKRGDIEEFRFERHIQNGFTSKDESFQTKVIYPTQHLAMKVTFPAQRFPKRVILTEQNTGKKVNLRTENIHFLPDGRQQVMWEVEHPKLFEVYSVCWQW